METQLQEMQIKELSSLNHEMHQTHMDMWACICYLDKLKNTSCKLSINNFLSFCTVRQFQKQNWWSYLGLLGKKTKLGHLYIPAIGTLSSLNYGPDYMYKPS